MGDDANALLRLRNAVLDCDWNHTEAVALADLLRQVAHHADAAGDWLVGDEE